MSLTIGDLTERIETDLSDDALQRILDAEEAAVTRSAGNATAETEGPMDASGNDKLTVSRMSSSVTSVSERRRHSSDAVTLSSNDYRKIGNITFLRLSSGDNPASTWGKEVTMVYVPVVDSGLRDEVTIALCLLNIEFKAFDREKGGDYEAEQKDYKARRRDQFARIREGRSPIL